MAYTRATCSSVGSAQQYQGSSIYGIAARGIKSKILDAAFRLFAERRSNTRQQLILLLLGQRHQREMVQRLERRQPVVEGAGPLGLDLPLSKQYVVFLSGALRNPAAAPKVFGNVLLGFALTEAIALFALLIALLLLFVF